MASQQVICIVYYNTSIVDGVKGKTFVSDYKKAFKVHSSSNLARLKNVIKKKLQFDDNVTITDIVYRHLVFFGENTTRFELMKVCDDDDVELMFDVYAQWSQLGTIELYITFESGPTSQHNTINPSQPSTSNMPIPSQHYEPYSTPYQPDVHSPSQHYQPYSSQNEQTQHVHNVSQQLSPYQPDIYSPSQHYQPYSSQNEQTQHVHNVSQQLSPYQPDIYSPSQHYQPYSSQNEQTQHVHNVSQQLYHESLPTSPQCDLPLSVHYNINEEELGDYSEDDETYFDESSGDSDDDDIDEDMEAEDQLIPPVFDPPFHMKNINLSTANQPTEFDHMFIDEVPNLGETLEVGMKFQNKDECVHAIKCYHLKQSLNFVVQKSDLERYVIICSHPNCLFRCRASKRKKNELWVIGKLNAPHTCTNSALSQDHTKLDSNMICASIMQVMRMDPSIKVKVIIAQIQALYNYTISYRKAWLGKNKAIEQIYGNWEKSYNLLPRWLLVMQTFALGTIIKMETIPAYNEHGLINGMTIFHRLFWAYVPCISAFKFCKPIVQVDGTWLYDKYNGTLLVAIAQDGNDNIIPIAYALVEGETKEA
ncbi:uncharacterized protein [Cicer arietinum]|uniref:uncharacterized protein n=1 Tax=Cicer arietinum TaxID=3827 RepID=UPI003CC5628F